MVDTAADVSNPAVLSGQASAWVRGWGRAADLPRIVMMDPKILVAVSKLVIRSDEFVQLLSPKQKQALREFLQEICDTIMLIINRWEVDFENGRNEKTRERKARS